MLKWEYVTLSCLQMELCQQGKSVLLLESYLVLNFQRNIKDTAGLYEHWPADVYDLAYSQKNWKQAKT